MDEVVFIYGNFVQAELDGLEKGKKESEKSFKLRKQQLFMSLTDQKQKQKFKSPMATK